MQAWDWNSWLVYCYLSGQGTGWTRKLETENPWFLLVLSLLGCAAAIYLLIRKTGNLK